MQTRAITAIEQALKIALTRCGARTPDPRDSGRARQWQIVARAGFRRNEPASIVIYPWTTFILRATARRARANPCIHFSPRAAYRARTIFGLLNATSDALLSAKPDARNALPPSTNKRRTEAPETWRGVPWPSLSLIILEGWSLGALPKRRRPRGPVNALETRRRCQGASGGARPMRTWQRDYAAMFARLTLLLS